MFQSSWYAKRSLLFTRVCETTLEGSFFLFFFFLFCLFSKKGRAFVCEQLMCKKAAPTRERVKWSETLSSRIFKYDFESRLLTSRERRKRVIFFEEEEEEKKKIQKSWRTFLWASFSSLPPFFSLLSLWLSSKKQFKRTLLRAEETTARFIPRLFSQYHAETRENTSRRERGEKLSIDLFWRRERRKKKFKKVEDFFVRVFFRLSPAFFFVFFLPLLSSKKTHAEKHHKTPSALRRAILNNARNTSLSRKHKSQRERESFREKRETLWRRRTRYFFFYAALFCAFKRRRRRREIIFPREISPRRENLKF